MKKAIAVGFLLLVFATLALAFDVTCPLHPTAVCVDTTQLAPNNIHVHKFHCSCGDDVWVQVE